MYTIYFMLYLIEILHQTTTPFEGFCPLSELYLIEILHQTTTSGLTRQIKRCCILSKFYIKPQLQMYTIYFTFRCILSKFYIKPQLMMTTREGSMRCILSKFYIKPQLQIALPLRTAGCILSKFYIKPQQTKQPQHRTISCILSKFYIKPQLKFFLYICGVRILHLITIRLYAEGFQPIVSAYSVETFFIFRE